MKRYKMVETHREVRDQAAGEYTEHGAEMVEDPQGAYVLYSDAVKLTHPKDDGIDWRKFN